MEVDHEPSVKRHVEKQKSMITHQRSSCPPPSATDLAGRQSRVRFCPWAFRLARDRVQIVGAAPRRTALPLQGRGRASLRFAR